MDWLTDELLSTGGIVLTIVSGVGWVIFSLLCRLKKASVMAQLTKEYGELPDFPVYSAHKMPKE